MSQLKIDNPKPKKIKEYAKDWLESVYKDMLLFRRFEEAANRAYNKQKFAGFCHLHIGQEGLCAGVQRALKDEDYVISAYRSHTQAIAKGIPPEQVLAELFGKKTGAVMGKGGSMHMFSKEKRFLGGHGIVGGQVPLGTGVGFKIRYREEDLVSVVYMGDGASNQGQVYEAMNMAACWNLPVIYIIENNKYGMGTDYRRVTAVDQLWKKALAFDMEHSQVDGMDFLKVYEHMEQIVERVRSSKKPHLVDALTYRYRGHSVSDPAKYRSKEELDKYRETDPIENLGKALQEAKIFTKETLDGWDQETKKQVKEIEKFADESEEPAIDLAYQHIFDETQEASN